MSSDKNNNSKEASVPEFSTVAEELVTSLKRQEEYINKAFAMNEIISKSLKSSSVQAISSFFEKQKSMIDMLSRSDYFNTMDKIERIVQQPDYLAGFEASKRIFDGLNYNLHFNQFLSKIESVLTAYKSIVDKITSPFWSTIDREDLSDLRNQWGNYGWSYLYNFPCQYIKHFPISQEDADACAMEFWDDPSILLDELKEKDFSAFDWQSVQEFKCCYENNQFKSCCMLLVSLIDSFMFNLQYKLPDLKVDKVRVNQKRIDKISEIELNEYAEDDYFNVRVYLWLSNVFATLMTLFSPSEEFKKPMTCINRHYLQHGMCNRIVDRTDCVKLLLLFINLKYCYCEITNKS